MTIDPNIELHINRKTKEERQASDLRYAVKLVEKIVFYGVGAGAIAILGALISLVIK